MIFQPTVSPLSGPTGLLRRVRVPYEARGLVGTGLFVGDPPQQKG